MTAWLDVVPAAAVVAAVLVLPGAAVAWFAGLRGYALLAGSIGTSLGIIALASVLAPFAGVRWSLIPIVILAAAISGAVALLAWRSAPRSPSMRVGRVTNRASSWVALIVAIVVCIALLTWGIQDPSHPSQHFDAVFHLNAVQHVIQSGSASPIDMTLASPLQDHSVYPTLWHAVVALIVPIAGGIVPATNVATIVVIALVWPAAVGFLAAVVWPSRVVAVAAPLLSLGFAIFPFGFLNWGVLYPNLIANAMVPIVLGGAALLLRPRQGPVWQSATIGTVVAASLAGTVVAHPSAALAAAALAVPLAAQRVIEIWRAGASPKHRITATATLVVGVALLAVIWWGTSRPVGEWHPYESLAQAIGESVFLGPLLRPPALLVAILAVIGAWAAIRRGSWWLVAGQAIACVLFIAAAWLPFARLRGLMVGVWYEDVTRVAAVLAFCALPLAAFGVHAVVRFVRSGRLRRRRMWFAVVAVALVPLAILQVAGIGGEVSHMRTGSFAFTENSQGLTPDEVALFEAAKTLVPEGGVVAGDPRTGAGLLYAYTGQPVLFPHIKGDFGPDAELLGHELRNGGTAVCDAIDRLGVTHVIDFGDRAIFPLYAEDFVGLHDLAGSDILTPVANVGEKVLFAVTGCD